MFVQVISGNVTDVDGLRRQLDRWDSELRPGAPGFLGSTGGATEDGRFVAMACFESADAAERNSNRPEQGTWWAETEKFVNEVVFHDCSEVHTMFGGGNDAATFVQAMRGRILDQTAVDRINARQTEVEATMKGARPDVIGEVIAVHGDGGFTDFIYFTSEADARAGEGKELTGDAKKLMDEMMSAFAIDEFFDLKDPWLR